MSNRDKLGIYLEWNLTEMVRLSSHFVESRGFLQRKSKNQTFQRFSFKEKILKTLTTICFVLFLFSIIIVYRYNLFKKFISRKELKFSGKHKLNFVQNNFSNAYIIFE